ncbi:hypothetical protein Tco_0038474 [Tanacetum coccineum]
MDIHLPPPPLPFPATNVPTWQSHTPQDLFRWPRLILKIEGPRLEQRQKTSALEDVKCDLAFSTCWFLLSASYASLADWGLSMSVLHMMECRWPVSKIWDYIPHKNSICHGWDHIGDPVYVQSLVSPRVNGTLSKKECGIRELALSFVPRVLIQWNRFFFYVFSSKSHALLDIVRSLSEVNLDRGVWIWISVKNVPLVMMESKRKITYLFIERTLSIWRSITTLGEKFTKFFDVVVKLDIWSNIGDTGTSLFSCSNLQKILSSTISRCILSIGLLVEELRLKSMAVITLLHYGMTDIIHDFSSIRW